MFRKKKHGTAMVLFVVFLAVALIGCNDSGGGGGGGTINVTDVSISSSYGGPDSATLWVGTKAGEPGFQENLTLTPVITPTDATNKNVNWTVTPSAFVTYNVLPNDSITIIANAPSGPTTVKVTTDDGGYEATFTITVMDTADFVPVETVTISSTAALSFIKDLNHENPAFAPASISLTSEVLPATASVQEVEWFSTDEDVAVVDKDGVVTPIGEGSAFIYAISVGVDEDGIEVESNRLEVTVTIIEVDDNPPVLLLYNQNTTPVEGTTTDLQAAWNDTTNRYTIRNTDPIDTNAGFYNNNASSNPQNVSVQNATFLYLNTPIESGSSISARIRITNRYGTESSATGGVIIGMMNDPESAVNQFVGVRVGNNGDLRRYISRTGGDNSASDFNPALAGRAFDDEYIIEVSRTTAIAHSIVVRDRFGVQLATSSVASGQNPVSIDPAYLGFIIARADVEISNIIIKEGATNKFTTAASDPTPILPAGINFTAPVGITGDYPTFEYTHSLAAGDTLNISANVLPAQAPQNISWSFSGDISSLSATTGLSTMATFSGAGTGTVTATAGEASATLTITVTDQAILVSSITIMAPKTTIMAGDGNGNLPETLELSANVMPNNAANSDVTWSVNTTSTFDAGTTAHGASINATTGLLTAPSTLVGEETIYVFAKAQDSGGVESAGFAVTLKPYSPPPAVIWEWTVASGDNVANDTSLQNINGKNINRKGGRISATNTSNGFEFNSSTTWALGVLSASDASTSSFCPVGQLDLSKKFKITIDHVGAGVANVVAGGNTAAGNVTIRIANTTNGGANSVFTQATAQQVQATTATAGTIEFIFDPDNFVLTSDAATAGVNKNDVLSATVMSFQIAPISIFTRIRIEYVD